MERTTEFNLITAIEAWKETLMASGNFNNEQVLELESHLMDEMDSLENDQLSNEEKFIIARHRIGSEKVLTQAYKQNERLTFQKLSWFIQAIIFMSIFAVVSRITTLLVVQSPLDGHSWVETSFLGATLLVIGMKLPAILLTYLTYRWTQKQTKIIRGNGIALITLTAICGIYLLQTFTFRSETVLINKTIWPMFWAASTYILVFIGFIIMNIKESRKLKRTAQA